MADIAKCSKPCDIRAACYRFTAVNSVPHQWYGDPIWQNGECVSFIPARAVASDSERAERSDAQQGNLPDTVTHKSHTWPAGIQGRQI